MKRLFEILEGIRPDVDFRTEKALMSNGTLDSFDIVSIISELNDEYNISIRVNELSPANFDTAEAIMNMVSRLSQGK